MIKQILFDFDGVIVDSMSVRDYGFRTIMKGHEEKLIDAFIDYHRYNAGLSRYVKIRYFYEELLGKPISDEEVNALAYQFSIIMKEQLIDRSILISETVKFIESIYQKIPLHIVSGSDEKELNYLCDALGLLKYFVTIEGSPTPKNKLVSDIMNRCKYNSKETVLIGDSINDHEAAKKSYMYFVGFNNENLKEISDLYVDVVDESLLRYFEVDRDE